MGKEYGVNLTFHLSASNETCDGDNHAATTNKADVTVFEDTISHTKWRYHRCVDSNSNDIDKEIEHCQGQMFYNFEHGYLSYIPPNCEKEFDRQLNNITLKDNYSYALLVHWRDIELSLSSSQSKANSKPKPKPPKEDFSSVEQCIKPQRKHSWRIALRAREYSMNETYLKTISKRIVELENKNDSDIGDIGDIGTNSNGGNQGSPDEGYVDLLTLKSYMNGRSVVGIATDTYNDIYSPQTTPQTLVLANSSSATKMNSKGQVGPPVVSGQSQSVNTQQRQSVLSSSEKSSLTQAAPDYVKNADGGLNNSDHDANAIQRTEKMQYKRCDYKFSNSELFSKYH